MTMRRRRKRSGCSQFREESSNSSFRKVQCHGSPQASETHLRNAIRRGQMAPFPTTAILRASRPRARSNSKLKQWTLLELLSAGILATPFPAMLFTLPCPLKPPLVNKGPAELPVNQTHMNLSPSPVTSQVSQASHCPYSQGRAQSVARVKVVNLPSSPSPPLLPFILNLLCPMD